MNVRSFWLGFQAKSVFGAGSTGSACSSAASGAHSRDFPEGVADISGCTLRAVFQAFTALAAYALSGTLSPT
jgi:hypothetical protein